MNAAQLDCLESAELIDVKVDPSPDAAIDLLATNQDLQPNHDQGFEDALTPAEEDDIELPGGWWVNL